MRFVINTASTHKGGSVQVALSFLEEARNFRDHEFHVILGMALSGTLRPSSYSDRFRFYEISYRPGSRVVSLGRSSSFHEQVERAAQPDAVFTTSGPAYWRPAAPHLVGYNLPHYVYHDSPFWLQLSPLKRLKWTLKGKAIRALLRHEGDAFVVQTEDVNRRLRSFLGCDRVFTVTNTCCSHYFRSAWNLAKLPPKRAGEFRLLTLSAWYPHKHLEVIPDVVDMLPVPLRGSALFVLTLPDGDFERVVPPRYRNQIVNVGPIKVEEGPSLYRECDALFLPSLLECFSASYAEAMATGKPILTSDLSFARGICGDAAVYFNPMDPGSIAQKIAAVVGSETLRRDLIANGYARLSKFDSPSNRARKYLEICETIAR